MAGEADERGQGAPSAASMRSTRSSRSTGPCGVLSQDDLAVRPPLPAIDPDPALAGPEGEPRLAPTRPRCAAAPATFRRSSSR